MSNSMSIIALKKRIEKFHKGGSILPKDFLELSIKSTEEELNGLYDLKLDRLEFIRLLNEICEEKGLNPTYYKNAEGIRDFIDEYAHLLSFDVPNLLEPNSLDRKKDMGNWKFTA